MEAGNRRFYNFKNYRSDICSACHNSLSIFTHSIPCNLIKSLGKEAWSNFLLEMGQMRFKNETKIHLSSIHNFSFITVARVSGHNWRGQTYQCWASEVKWLELYIQLFAQVNFPGWKWKTLKEYISLLAIGMQDHRMHSFENSENILAIKLGIVSTTFSGLMARGDPWIIGTKVNRLGEEEPVKCYAVTSQQMSFWVYGYSLHWGL